MQKPTPDTLRAWHALLVAHRRLTTVLDAELRASTGLSLDEYDVLFQLSEERGAITMSDLATRLLVSRPSTTRAVDRLVTQGFIVREPDAHDRRRVLVALTADGRRAQRTAARVHLDGIARHVGRPLATHDPATLTAGLRALGHADRPSDPG